MISQTLYHQSKFIVLFNVHYVIQHNYVLLLRSNNFCLYVCSSPVLMYNSFLCEAIRQRILVYYKYVYQLCPITIIILCVSAAFISHVQLKELFKP